jgi:hypothetical protein
MSWAFRLAADIVVLAHASYVLFVLLGQLVILTGWLCGWQWIRNRWFRATHLAAIGIVVAESWCGITCPLTTLEQWLRSQAGDVAYRGDFLGNMAHELLFVDWEPWVFTLVYTAFGLLVLLTFLLVPPRWK